MFISQDFVTLHIIHCLSRLRYHFNTLLRSTINVALKIFYIHLFILIDCKLHSVQFSSCATVYYNAFTFNHIILLKQYLLCLRLSLSHSKYTYIYLEHTSYFKYLSCQIFMLFCY